MKRVLAALVLCLGIGLHSNAEANFPNGVTPTIDPTLALNLGLYPGQFAGLVNGYVGTSATSTVVVRATPYAAQGTNAQRSFSSNNASDTAAGTGAQKITIKYLSIDMASYKTDTITMNGTTAVNSTATDIALIESMQVSQAGTGGGNVGTISIFTLTGGGGSVWGSIAASDNQTYWAHHYVLSGQTCVIKSITGIATVTSGQINIQQIGTPTASPNTSPQLPVGSTYLHGNNVAASLPAIDHTFGAPPTIAGPAIVFINEKPVAITGSTTFASFEYLQF